MGCNSYLAARVTARAYAAANTARRMSRLGKRTSPVHELPSQARLSCADWPINESNEPHQLLTEILALEEPHERPRRRGQSIDDALPVFDFARA